MKGHRILLAFCIIFSCTNTASSQDFSLKSVTSYPFPSGLTSSSTGSRIAVSINQSGKRNIYVAEGPAFELRKLTNYNSDEGQEITGISISPDGNSVVYVRGGDHGAYDESVPRNPMSNPVQQKILINIIPFSGGEPITLDEGDYPVFSPDSKTIAYLKNNEVWQIKTSAEAKAGKMFTATGKNFPVGWSPDGKQFLFVSSRKDHSFIGLYSDSVSPVKWIDPAFSKDESPHWSPDGKKIVFVRRQASGGKPDSLTVPHIEPWSIRIADATTGSSKQVWESPQTLMGSVPETEGGYNLHYAADEKIIFTSIQDGWPHLYSISSNGGTAKLLTPGNYMVEQIKMSRDGKYIVASANTGKDSNDIDRRHIIKINIEKASEEMMTSGDGIESYPSVTGNGESLVFFRATASVPGLIASMPFKGGKMNVIGKNLLPADFPSTQLVSPKPVKFVSSDGLTIHAQLFEPKKRSRKNPAIVFIHGGPERQMLLGWHYGDYYANTYALNQFLASKGFVVLSVNYRLGIGYGYQFQNPSGAWLNGAAEYNDVKAAGEWLAKQPGIDSSKIGVYGGSYGGFLTALALAKDSKLFAAGVDVHGMHNLLSFYNEQKGEQPPDASLSKELIWRSSPDAWLDTWTSPVLLIHGDDDGNVEFSQTIDLVKRFEKKGFKFESMVVPDETHHWLKYSNMLKVDDAIAEFLTRKLSVK